MPTPPPEEHGEFDRVSNMSIQSLQPADWENHGGNDLVKSIYSRALLTARSPNRKAGLAGKHTDVATSSTCNSFRQLVSIVVAMYKSGGHCPPPWLVEN
jgi:hypothetical protein